MVYDVEKNAKEWSDRLESSMKQRLEEAVDGAKKALRAGDPEEIRKASEALQAAYSEAGRSLYQQAQPSTGAGPEPSAGPAGPEEKKPEDVVEADYEIVDDQEKKP
jgi:molecular chaperone DnaK